MSNYCVNCGTNKRGSKYCPGCQEEAYIYNEQYLQREEDYHIEFSDEFMDKLKYQEQEADRLAVKIKHTGDDND
ncbi:hypothetical protein HGO23_12755 [Xenorhabdus budapestensis]|uniref:Uncharacterized protein n=1 Tax=Xenorhabdus budapestensis TaxID=290110 RepID=A0ABX7VIX4_XENBU|nr:hypothetical protein [Xenorhabdus budapestensis]QTL38749.1 hypothetical protein HGO23_12755 [Xenorhabdus budapestensis]